MNERDKEPAYAPTKPYPGAPAPQGEDWAEFLLTPELMQALTEERTEGEEEDADAAALVPFH